MSTADRFDRYVESLMGELADQGNPAYLEDALATATARPQQRPSLVSRLLTGRTGSNPAFRFATVGVSVLLLLTIGIVGLLMIGGQDPTPSPSPIPTLTGTDAPGTLPPTSAPPTSAPTDAAIEPCPSYAESADARTLDETVGNAWQVETGPPPPIASRREGLIAAEARDLPNGRPTVVLIDPATGHTCRLIDLDANEQVHEFQWTLRGDALAIATQSRALVWSSAGLVELHRLPDDRTSGYTLAWSPTGEAIAVAGGGQGLRIVERTASWTDLTIDTVHELAWSPDGRRLHVGYGAHTGGSVLHAVISGQQQSDPIDIGSAVDNGESVAGWLDNDTLIVGSSGEQGYDAGAPGYDTYDVASGTRQPWASTEPFNRPIGIGYSPGLTAVALFPRSETQDALDLVIRELPSGVDRVMEKRIRAEDQVGTGAWSPNGSRLAVSIQAGPGAPRTGLWLYALDGGEPTQVSTMDLWLTNGAWQPVP